MYSIKKGEKMKKEMEQKLEKKLLPLVKEASKLSCFRGGVTDKEWCMCSGDNQDEHWKKQERLEELEKQMIKIIKEITDKDGVRYPGTYNDFCFVTNILDGTSIIGIDSNGIIKDSRSYY